MTHNNTYIRPQKTFQDSLTKDEISKQLIGYKLVDNISKVPLGSQIKYFKMDNNIKKFRMGGKLTKIDSQSRYIKLENDQGYGWSVQLSDSTIFQRVSDRDLEQEIKDKYEKEYREKFKRREEELKKTASNSNKR
jgi:hypothetical protein